APHQPSTSPRSAPRLGALRPKSWVPHFSRVFCARSGRFSRVNGHPIRPRLPRAGHSEPRRSRAVSACPERNLLFPPDLGGVVCALQLSCHPERSRFSAVAKDPPLYGLGACAIPPQPR